MNPYSGDPSSSEPLNPYGVEPTDPYGQPAQPSLDPYGQPAQPSQDPYGQPAQPSQDPYGQPSQQYGGSPQNSYNPSGYNNNGYNSYNSSGVMADEPEDGKAIGGLICSICSIVFFFFCCLGLILAPIGMVLCKQAMNAGNTTGKAKAGWIVGIVGLVLNILWVLLWVILFIVGIANS